MGRTAMERKKIYKETVEAVLRKYRMSKGEFCEAMEHTAQWFGTTFAKGWYDITKPNLKLWAITIGCSEDELTAIPVSPQGKAENQTKADAAADSEEILTELQAISANVAAGFLGIGQHLVTDTKIDELHEMIRSGLKLLHTDLMMVYNAVRGEE